MRHAARYAMILRHDDDSHAAAMLMLIRCYDTLRPLRHLLSFSPLR